MPNILIRPERPSDIPAIRSLLNAAFKQNDEGLLVRELRATKSFIGEFSWVIEQAGVLIGYLLLYPINIETSTGKLASLALAPMAVAPDEQGKGWGSKLVNHAFISFSNFLMSFINHIKARTSSSHSVFIFTSGLVFPALLYQ